jgi:membrane protein implicated in regulation of membrane protease activity
MHPSIWWALLGVALMVIEMAATTFFLLWFGVGAFLTALFSLFVPTVWAQYTFFAVASVLLVAATRRWAQRLTGPAARPANMDALVGQEGRVIELVDGAKGLAVVKVAGETWRAETEDSSPLEAGAPVTVKATRGNTLVLKGKM